MSDTKTYDVEVVYKFQIEAKDAEEAKGKSLAARALVEQTWIGDNCSEVRMAERKE